jgi:cardiolipin synthase
MLTRTSTAACTGLARLPTVRGNAVELLIDGDATFASIEAGLRRARHYILFQFYILRDDGLGRRLGAVLAERARAGVRVYILYDEVGSAAFRPQLAVPRAACAPACALPPSTPPRADAIACSSTFATTARWWSSTAAMRLDRRAQRRRRVSRSESPRGPWRDTHVRLHGPVVIGAELTFATDWLWATPRAAGNRLAPRARGTG